MFLNCHTAFSFKYGTLTVQQLFDEAKRCGVRKLVLSEINNTASYIEMLRLCSENRSRENGLNQFGQESWDLDIAVGIEFRNPAVDQIGNELLFIAIAQNNDGFEELNRFLSYHNRENKPFPSRAPGFQHVSVVYPYGKFSAETLHDNEYLGVRKNQIHQYLLDENRKTQPGKFVIHHPVTFTNKLGFNVHRLLRAIDNNILLSKLQPHQQAEPDEIMIPEPELAKFFERCPELIDNTKALLSSCSIDLALKEDKNKRHLTGSEESDWDYLVTKAWEGFQKRYDVTNADLRERFDRELKVIKLKGFCGYYLIAYDLITFANEHGYAYVGRGSGANSVVAYCLGITNVDPIELNLYFERFLNEERSSPPDFDIDFSWDNRDAIYDYLFQRHGYDHVCLLGTHVTYQGRSILRELGKVFGLPKDEIDEIVEYPAQNKNRDHITQLIFRYAEYMKDLPSNMSIHAGGVLITQEPIYRYTATELPQKGYPVSHFDMHSAEDAGIYKFDILSQRGLGHIKEAAWHIQKNRGIAVDVNRFEDFKKDDKVRDLLRNSKAMGCFYVESPAMRMLLTKLQCEDYLTLVAASSIIRPGVSSSGMMKTYIERFHAVRSGKSYDVIHPKMEELMRETFGVMVYQEDVIKVAHHFAGLTLTEADVLRRGMSGKYRSREEFQRVKNQFFEQCQKRQYPAHVIDRVWYEIESFSGYSFAKGHSASYAVESYQSLYLKAHFPLEFMVGVINNFGGFYKTEFYFHEARMNGGQIEAPCINRSDYLTSIDGTQIFIGFIHVKSLEQKLAREICMDRARRGIFTNMNDFLSRITCGLEQLRILIRIGAFRFTGLSKQQLLWEAMLYFNQSRERKQSTTLFNTDPKNIPLPSLSRHRVEDAFDEIELLGFPLCDPFTLLQTRNYGDTTAEALLKRLGSKVSIVGYLVTSKDTSTRSRELMHFGTFLDCKGKVFDTVHFPNIARQFPFRGRGFYELHGKIVEDFGVPMIEVSRMEKLPMINKRAEEFMRENTTVEGAPVRLA